MSTSLPDDPTIITMNPTWTTTPPEHSRPNWKHLLWKLGVNPKSVVMRPSGYEIWIKACDYRVTVWMQKEDGKFMWAKANGERVIGTSDIGTLMDALDCLRVLIRAKLSHVQQELENLGTPVVGIVQGPALEGKCCASERRNINGGFSPPPR